MSKIIGDSNSIRPTVKFIDVLKRFLNKSFCFFCLNITFSKLTNENAVLNEITVAYYQRG